MLGFMRRWSSQDTTAVPVTVEDGDAAPPPAMNLERVKHPQVLLASCDLADCLKRAKAEFDSIVVRHRALGEKYIDVDFPASTDPTAVVYRKKDEPNSELSMPHEWKRLSDVCEKPELFVDGAASADIQQGRVGTCYLLGAMAVVAAYREHTEDLFVGYDSDVGVACVRFFKNGKWTHVIIDDFVGLNKDGALWGAHCADKNEVWVPLMEKAYARLHGSYEDVHGGRMSSAMIDLTGGSGDFALIKDKLGNADAAYYYLKSVLERNYMVACSIDGANEAQGCCGLFTGHAYSILRTFETSHDHKLIQLRNPWGSGEWTGAWSDKSSMWSDDLLADAGYKIGEDGMFWMSAEDFTKHYNVVDMCRVFKDPWVVSAVSGTFAASDMACAHYKIQAAAAEGAIGRAVIVLSQQDKRLERNGKAEDYDVHIGFSVWKCKRDEYHAETHDWGEKLEYVYAVPLREVSTEIDVDPKYTYIVIVGTADMDNNGEDDGVNQRYSLRCYASLPITLEDTGAPPFKPEFEIGTRVAIQQQVDTKRYKGQMSFYGTLSDISLSSPHYIVTYDAGVEPFCVPGIDGESEAYDAVWMKGHHKLYNCLQAMEKAAAKKKAAAVAAAAGNGGVSPLTKRRASTGRMSQPVPASA